MKRKTHHYAVVAALCALCALCQLSAAQDGEISFAGFFETTIEITQTSSLTVKSIALNSVLSIGDWLASADAKFTDSQFDTLTVYAAGLLGNVTLNSSLVFNPSTLSFVSWQSGASFNLLDLAVSDVLYIASSQTSSYNLLTLSGTVDGLSLQGTFKTGICPLCFWEASLCANWLWTLCDANLQACVQVNDTGFNSLSVAMTGLSLFESVLGIEGLLDASISFTVDEKTFSPTLRFVPDWPICIDIELLGEISVSSSPIEVNAMLIYGLVGECTLGNGVTFTFAESLSEEKNSSVTGKAEYWEVFRISGPLPSCCDDVGSFEIGTYFGGTPPPPSSLFGVGLFTASFDLRLFNGFGVTFDADYPTNGTGWSFAVTLRVFW